MPSKFIEDEVSISMHSNLNTNCGKMKLKITYDVELQNYEVWMRMQEFGNCAAYKLLGDAVSQMLNSEDPRDVADKLENRYKCEKGTSGCAKLVGRAIREFEERTKN